MAPGFRPSEGAVHDLFRIAFRGPDAQEQYLFGELRWDR